MISRACGNPVKFFSKVFEMWALRRQNLSSGFPTKGDSNLSPHLQKLARILKFHY